MKKLLVITAVAVAGLSSAALADSGEKFRPTLEDRARIGDTAPLVESPAAFNDKRAAVDRSAYLRDGYTVVYGYVVDPNGVVVDDLYAEMAAMEPVDAQGESELHGNQDYSSPETDALRSRNSQ